MHLFVLLDEKCLSSRGPSGEVGDPPYRLRGSRRQKRHSVAAQCSIAGVRLGKGRGPAQRGLALFRFTFVRTKVNPGVRGWVSPGRLRFGAGEAPWLRSRPAAGESKPLGQIRRPGRCVTGKARPAMGESALWGRGDSISTKKRRARGSPLLYSSNLRTATAALSKYAGGIFAA